MRRSSISVIGVSILLLSCATRESLAVRITQNGTVIFNDDFEGGTVDEPFGPAPGPATWSFNFNGTSTVLVTNSATPGSFQGTKYGEINRPAGYAAQANADSLPEIADGDSLKVELMVYIPSGQPTYGFYCGFEDTTENRAVAMGITASGDVITDNRSLGAWDDTGLDIAFDSWQKWEQEWVVGSNSKTITVDGNAVTLQGADSGGNPITLFFLASIGGGHYYVDGVGTAPVAGDYNGNGIVDAADYTIWRNHLGQSFQLANEGGITPGVVNADDYSFWKSRFGATSGSGAGSVQITAIPEPTCAAIAVAGIAGVIAAGSRRRNGILS